MQESKSLKYHVYVDDNFHYMDESERYLAGVYDDCEAAVKKCIEIVEGSLADQYEQGMGADELLKKYTFFGEDPWISGPDDQCKFSAREYAERRAEEICKENR